MQHTFNTDLYRRRKLSNAVGLTLSTAAMGLGLVVLLWIPLILLCAEHMHVEDWPVAQRRWTSSWAASRRAKPERSCKPWDSPQVAPHDSASKGSSSTSWSCLGGWRGSRLRGPL